MRVGDHRPGRHEPPPWEQCALPNAPLECPQRFQPANPFAFSAAPILGQDAGSVGWCRPGSQGRRSAIFFMLAAENFAPSAVFGQPRHR